MNASFDAYVTSALFDAKGQAAFALGDGTVRFDDGSTVEVHPDAAVQCAALHPSGQGLVTGGDDGRLVWSRAGEAPVELANLGSRWIDAVATSAESGLIAFAAGKEARVLDARDARFERVFAHERSVAGVAFDPKGRRLACATYNGAVTWFARIETQTPQMLKWAGSHVGVEFTPDGRFLVTVMQENALHGWRLADGRDMRMTGYAAKPRSLAFPMKGRLLATSGAQGVVLWPFDGASGPMGKEAAEIGFREGVIVTRVAAAQAGRTLCAGCDDGRVWLAELTSSRTEILRDAGAPITALAMSSDCRRIAFGDEAGEACVLEAPF